MKKNLLNFLIKLKNGSILKKEFILSKFSKQKLKICLSLYNEGFIQSFKVLFLKKNIFICVFFRNFFNKSLLSSLFIFSTKNHSGFLTLTELSKISNKKGILFISTIKGLFTLYQCKKLGLGGKALFLC
jgi:ribosomal protein S8